MSYLVFEGIPWDHWILDEIFPDAENEDHHKPESHGDNDVC
jgi:hypothetical protein